MHSLGRRFLWLACVALVVASSAAAASPSHVAFVAHADSICTNENAQANALTAPTSRSTIVTYLAKTITIVQHARSSTLALPAPASDRSLIKLETAAVAKELVFLREAKAAVVANEPSEYQTDVGQAKAFHDAGAAFAKKLGLKSCQA
jgi:hypothetical protein